MILHTFFTFLILFCLTGNSWELALYFYDALLVQKVTKKVQFNNFLN